MPNLPDYCPGPEFVTQFFEAFRHCHAATLGFEFPVYGNQEGNTCFCPCSKYMKNWQKLYCIEKGMNELYTCKQDNPFDPKGSGQHLKSNCSCPLHAGIQKFVDVYYGHFNAEGRSHCTHISDQNKVEESAAV